MCRTQPAHHVSRAPADQVRRPAWSEDNNVTPEALHDFIGQQNEAGKAEFAKEVQAVHEEIERDLPKQEPPMRQTRVRPTRQMI